MIRQELACDLLCKLFILRRNLYARIDVPHKSDCHFGQFIYEITDTSMIL